MMLDLKTIRENKALVIKKISDRGQACDLDGLLNLDRERVGLVREAEDLKRRRNKASEEISRQKKKNKPVDVLMAEMRQVSDRIKELDDKIRLVEEQTEARLLEIPNLLHDSVPIGKGEKENQEVRRWGTLPEFDFPPRSHWDLGETLGILDFERAARMTGSRFVLYKGSGARLERALMNFMLDLHIREHGYEEIMPPLMVNRASMIGTGQLPKFEEDLFRLKDNDYFLIPTAEVPLTNIHREEILEEDQLPISYVAYTPCFRREAGSYGKDTRGLIRQHQFNKVELVKFTSAERSYEDLEKLLKDAETILQRLGLPYRIVVLCSGDTGFAAAKTYDIEVWLSGQNAYREISSCSNFESFQARRAGIRYRMKGTKKTGYAHTLNGSGLAIGRTVVAILENFQQKDGSVTIPEALRPYMDGLERIAS